MSLPSSSSDSSSLRTVWNSKSWMESMSARVFTFERIFCEAMK